MSCFGDGSGGEIAYRVELLDDSAFNVSVKGRAKGEELMNGVLAHLNLVERDYFGLRYLDDLKNTHWLDLQKRIRSQLKKRRASPTFYFGVKFYAADPCKLHEEITRYHYFLQVRRDVTQGRIPLNFDASVELCSLIIQAEAGDYDEQRHGAGYVSEFRLMPNQSEELEEAVAAAHQKLKGMKPSSAEMSFLQRIKEQEMYGVDLHRAKVKDLGEFFIGLTPGGVVVYRNGIKVSDFSWPQITNVSFNRKEFNMRINDGSGKESVHEFELPSMEACHHLWKCCVEHHSFFRLSEIKERRRRSTSFLSFGSKYRYSGRTEWQALAEAPRRPPPQVPRRPSRRQENRQRRYRRDESKGAATASAVSRGLDQSSTAELNRGLMSMTAPSSTPSVIDSPRSVRSAPWMEQPIGGLFTSGKDSPRSVRSERIRFPGRVAQSRLAFDGVSDCRQTPRRNHEDAVSKQLAVTAGMHDRLFQRRGSGDSDYSSVSHHHHHHHRHKRYQRNGLVGGTHVTAGSNLPRRPLKGLEHVDYSGSDAAAVLAADAYYVNISHCEMMLRDSEAHSRRAKHTRTCRHHRHNYHKKVSRNVRQLPPGDSKSDTATAGHWLPNESGMGAPSDPQRDGFSNDGRSTASDNRTPVKRNANLNGHTALNERQSSSSVLHNRRLPVARNGEAVGASQTPDKRQRGNGDGANNLSAVLLMSHAPLVKLHSGNGSIHAVTPGTYGMTTETDSSRYVPPSSFKVSVI